MPACLATAATLIAMMSTSPVPPQTGQMIIIVTDDWSSVKGEAHRFERRGRSFHPVGRPFPVVVGQNGLGWGLGLHRSDSLAGPRKQEGDQRGVAGVFRLARAMGYAATPPRRFKIPYQPAREQTRCVDDPAAEQYNQIVEVVAGEAPPWTSAERMRRDDELYRWLVVIEHNTAQPIQRGRGSCIFFHLWRAPDRGTLGCTAASEERVLELLAFLDPARSPVLIQLPRAVYQELRVAWGLPEVRRLTDLERVASPPLPRYVPGGD